MDMITNFEPEIEVLSYLGKGGENPTCTKDSYRNW